jgi:diaminohydroxyphosphoribosylaminopyrimidine deaminase/5-amino-6-(5-phosphoribosylamino)uracil reductase
LDCGACASSLHSCGIDPHHGSTLDLASPFILNRGKIGKMADEANFSRDACFHDPWRPPATAMNDLAAMRIALSLARRGLGVAWPNPTVGCVIAVDGEIVGRGWTQPGGRPHGETEALARAGTRARGATAYVSLEPCSHWGKTPPCADALVTAGIARVVAPIEDPDPRVSGRGIAHLRDAGVAVELGLCAAEAEELNAGFLTRIRAGRPLVTLKLATSLDGRIATARGQSQWITGDTARRRAHLLRATHDAVMVGSNTVLSDDPLLTCRLPGLEDRSPVRIVVDGRLRVPLTARLVADAARAPAWFLVREGVDEARRRAFAECGIEIVELPVGPSGEELDLGAALDALGHRGLTRVLVEGGGGLAAALMSAGLVDRIAWFRAAMVVGGDGIPAVAALGLDTLGKAPRFTRIGIESVGEDVLETLRRAP